MRDTDGRVLVFFEPPGGGPVVNKKEIFLGDVILEGLNDPSFLKAFDSFLMSSWTQPRPNHAIPLWHINRYALPREKVLVLTRAVIGLLRDEGWYVHFYSEHGNDLYVMLKGRLFLLPKQKSPAWDEMIRYGERVGVDRKWTESIPIPLPDIQ